MTVCRDASLLLAMCVSLPAALSQPCTLSLSLTEAVARQDGQRLDLVVEVAIRDATHAELLGGHFRLDQCGAARHSGRVTECSVAGDSIALTLEVSVNPHVYSPLAGIGTYRVTLRPGPDQTLAGEYEGSFSLANSAPVKMVRKSWADKSQAKNKNIDLKKLPPGIRDTIAKRQEAKEVSGRIMAPETIDQAFPDPRRDPVVQQTEVRGLIRTEGLEVWPDLIPGHVPPEPGEHPRLIFRKADLPRLRQRAEQDPVGRAIMERFWQVADAPPPTQGGNQPAQTVDADDPQPGGNAFCGGALAPNAVGLGFAYAITQKTAYADKAKALIDQEYLSGIHGGQDIHFGARLMVLSLAFDLCYDAWDETFRRRCVDEIQQSTLECFTGTILNGKPMGGYNTAWWSNHNGIRVSGAGLGALAVLGEKNSAGVVMGTAREIADRMAWEAMLFLRDGLGGGNWCMEGLHYKCMTMRRGLTPFIRAYPLVTGRAIHTATLGPRLNLGFFLEAEPGRIMPKAKPFDGTDDRLWVDGEYMTQILWPTATVAIPEAAIPGVRHLIDRNVGLQGDKSFGITQGFYAPFALATYPFGIDAAPPSECFPWLSPDPHTGHWLVRPVWKDGNDILFVLANLSSMRRSCHYERIGPWSDWRLLGFGQTWLAGRYHPLVEGRPEAVSALVGPSTRAWHADGRILSAVFDASPAYQPDLSGLQQGASQAVAETAARARGGIGVTPGALGGHRIDYGIRATRHIVVDCSGTAGVPFLLALAERIDAPVKDGSTGPAPFSWTLPFARDGGLLKTEGSGLTLTKGQAVLAGVVLASGKLAADGSVRVADGVLVSVFALASGPPPAFTIDGTGSRATVRLGKRAITFTGEAFRVE